MKLGDKCRGKWPKAIKKGERRSETNLNVKSEPDTRLTGVQTHRELIWS